jgi:bacteriocin biosynthesis cyclodehydratase domain-containing protein
VNRPTLIPGLTRVWRGASELQLGSDPARAVVLQLPDPRAACLLDLLDGTRPERAVLLHAAGLGVPPAEARALLDTLHAAGLVLPAASLIPATLADHTRHRLLGEAAALAWQHLTAEPPDPAATPARALRRRAAARVVITGHGRLGAGIAVALAEAGVGHVHPDLPGLVGPGELAAGPLRGIDIGRPRRETIAAAVQLVAPTTQTHGVRRVPASLVVQLDHDQPVTLVAAAHLARRQPHLAVTIREGAAVIGPLVPPTGAPCLNCLDLHRLERDAAWPGGPQRKAAEPGAVTTLLAATAFAAAEVLTFLDGGVPQTLGASAEIGAPGRMRRRTWPPHPACPCARHPRTARADPARIEKQ